MNKEKPYFLKRAVAYLIDIIIVMLLSGILSTVFLNNNDYKKQSQRLLELTSSYTQGDITKEEYYKEFDNINYYLTNDSVGTTIITLSVTIVYFVILCFYCGGITLGKRIMKLGIVSANGKKLNLGNYLLRSLLVNLVLSNIASITLVLLLNKDTFISIYPKVSNVLTVLLLATVIFIMYREDGRGLHDLMANTKVISTKKDKNAAVAPEVKEAEVIKEEKRKHTNNRSKKEK